MTLYNNIFHFLMQVKWAKWSLESIQVKGQSMGVWLNSKRWQLGWNTLFYLSDLFFCVLLFIIYVCSSLSYSAHTLEVSSSLLHKLLLLRSKLLHFVNSIYHYLMTRVRHLMTKIDTLYWSTVPFNHQAVDQLSHLPSSCWSHCIPLSSSAPSFFYSRFCTV